MSAPVRRPESEADRHLRRQQRRDRGPAAALLGHRLAAIDRRRDLVEVEFQAGPHLFNPLAVMQGGFTAAMLDQAMRDAVLALTDLPGPVTTLAGQCNFLAAIGPGRLLCRAGLLRRGHSTAFAEARLYDSAGELAATATAVIELQPGGGA